MTRPVVQSVTTYAAAATATSHTIPMPATRPDGDLYVMIVSRRGTGSLTVPAAWTAFGADHTELTSLLFVRVLFRYGSSEPASYAVTCSTAQYVNAVVYRLTGAAAASPLELGASFTEAAQVGYVLCPRATASVADCLAIQWGAGNVSAANDKFQAVDGVDAAIAPPATATSICLAAKAIPAPRSRLVEGYAFANTGGSIQGVAATIFVKPITTVSAYSRNRATPAAGAAPDVAARGSRRRFKGDLENRYTGQEHFRRTLANMTRHSNEVAIRSDFWTYCCTGSGIKTFDDSFTYSLFFAEDANDTYTIRVSGFGNMKDRPIPWNTAWDVPIPSDPAADTQFVMYNLTTGEEHNAFMVVINHGTRTIQTENCSRLDTANNNTVYGSTLLDWRTGHAQYSQSRGAGLAYAACLVLPEEVERGVIGHALSMPMRSPNATFVAPAIKSDGPYEDAKLPEGMRFGLVCTDAEVDDAIDRLPNDIPDLLRHKYFARVYFKACRDYGMICTDHAGGAHIQFERTVTAAAQWAALGVAPHFTSGTGQQYPWHLITHVLPLNSPRLGVYSEVLPSGTALRYDSSTVTHDTATRTMDEL